MRAAELSLPGPACLALKIWTRSDQPLGRSAKGRKLAFRHVAGQNRAAVRREGRVLRRKLCQGGKEAIGRGADQRIEDEVGPSHPDFLDHPPDFQRSDRQIALAQHRAARRPDRLTRKAVHLPAPDVIRSGQIGPPSVDRHRPVQQRQKMLVRASMGVDHMIRRLEPLVGHGIPQRPAGLFQRGDHFLAAPGRDAADDMPRRGGVQDLLAQRAVEIDIAAGVPFDRNESDIAAGIGIHLSHRRQRPAAAGLRDQRIAACPRVEQPQFDPTFHSSPSERTKPRP